MARDVRATREQIIQAADALFYGEGIRSASMDAIAARASVTKRTIYYHFPSKDDLIAAYLTARDEPTFARASEALGTRVLMELIALVGYYDLLALSLTVWRTPLPAGAPPAF